jgi:hypothetical protein
VCEKILSRIGRDPDAILMMSGIAFAQQVEDVVELLGGENAPFLITKAPLIGSQTEKEKLFGKLDQMFLLNSRTHVPGSISNCLSFESNNSLSSIIPILMTASPKRIFIFGADGGKSKSSDDVYFSGMQRPDQEENANINNAYLGTLEKESEVCDNIMEFQVPWVSRLYNVEVPEIYNVCPTSNYNYFEKIDVDTAMTMLKSRGDQKKSSRQDKISTSNMKEIQQDGHPSPVQ